MKKRILLVEDEEILRSLYEEELEEEGYEVVSARNGQDALRQVEREKPDLVLLDIAMPVMDGIEALRRIKERDGGIPIILHTSHAKYREDSRSSRANGFVLKSIDLAELKKRVRELLE